MLQINSHRPQVSNDKTPNRKTPFPPRFKNLSREFKPASCNTKSTQFCCALQAQRTPGKSYRKGKDYFLPFPNGETLILLQQLRIKYTSSH